MVIIEETILQGVYIISNFYATDDRGLFVKMYNKKLFEAHNIDFEIKESFFSVSKKNVIRGMHFQLPPYDHSKLVYVSSGGIIDVVVDLRKNSKTFKQYISVELSAENKKSILISSGFAHGFKSLEDNTITIYNVDSEYNPMADAGIFYKSFGFNWELEAPIISQRDAEFDGLLSFCKINPF